MKQSNRFEIYSRIHFKVEKNMQWPSMGNDALSSYTLVSVEPLNEAMFCLACQELPIDIITMDMSNRMQYPLRAPNINRALARGITFELNYACAIRGMLMPLM
jgi:ribonuclease P/MRP protein subunit RPP1